MLPRPFNSESTTEDVLEGVDLTGKRAVVTGAANGLGLETARALASVGAGVILADCDFRGAAQAAQRIAESTENVDVRAADLDLCNPTSVKTFVDDQTDPLHVLVNNAAMGAGRELRRTPNGWEVQFASNHLGHFLLTFLLQDALEAADGARVISVSSTAHARSPVVFDDVMFRRRRYDPTLAYAQSKTANILFAVGASIRWPDASVTVNAAIPGAVVAQPGPRVPSGRTLNGQNPSHLKSVEQGASTTVWLATSALLNHVSGRCFQDNAEAPLSDNPAQHGTVQRFAVDPDDAARLWRLSADLLNL